MKVGFTPEEVTSLYHGLSYDVWTDLSLSIPVPDVRFAQFNSVFKTALAATNFWVDDAYEDNSFFSDPTITGYEAEPERLPHAHTFEFNTIFLPYFYEDEMIGTILHEIAHAIAGIEEAHSKVWSDIAQTIGGHHHQSMLLRKAREAGTQHGIRGLVLSSELYKPWYEVYA